jgi:hypothetical protein
MRDIKALQQRDTFSQGADQPSLTSDAEEISKSQNQNFQKKKNRQIEKSEIAKSQNLQLENLKSQN